MSNKSTALELHDFHPKIDDLKETLLSGLAAPQKRLPSLYFYDEYGSKLFDRITELPEYYPTRTERAILHDKSADIADLVGPEASLIEYGSGSSDKTRILLDNLHELAAYVPVDISRDHLMAAAEKLATDYPNLEILPVCADFTQHFDLPTPATWPRRNLVFFPGSTIGNFDREGARHLLEVMRDEAKQGGAILIGVDLKKDRPVLERAYNDTQGVTAAFNLNMLTRLNREYDGTFDPRHFHHRAVWNADEGRIEMHIVSERAQTASVGGQDFHFGKDEYILTEWSYKYAREEFAALAESAGSCVTHVWTDASELFSLQYLEC